MKGKKHRIFLFRSLAVFLASVIAFIVIYFITKFEVDKLMAQNPDTQFQFGLGMSLILGTIFAIVALGLELSFIRSVYKMLKHNPKGIIKICYVISAFLAFSGLVLYLGLVFGIIGYVSPTGRYYTGDMYLIQFPLFILSFILGSLPLKINEDNEDIIGDTDNKKEE